MNSQNERLGAGWSLSLFALIITCVALSLSGCGLGGLNPSGFNKVKFIGETEDLNQSKAISIEGEENGEAPKNPSIVIKPDNNDEEESKLIITDEKGKKKVYILSEEEGEQGQEKARTEGYDEDKSIVSVRGEDIYIAKDQLVKGDVVTVGNNLTVEGEVLGDVVCVGGELTVSESAVVHGDVVNVGGVANVSEKATIGGSNVNIGINLPWGLFSALEELPWLFKIAGLGMSILWLGFLLLLTIIIVAFAPQHLDVAREAFQKNFLKIALVGIGGFFVSILICLLLAITIIGIPLVLLFVLSMLIGGWFGVVAFTRAFMAKLFPRMPERKYLTPVLGVLLLYSVIFLSNLIALIPGSAAAIISQGIYGLGSAIMFCAFVLGLGVLLITRFGRKPVTEKQKAGIKEKPAKA
jgi:hypothetical protein